MGDRWWSRQGRNYREARGNDLDVVFSACVVWNALLSFPFPPVKCLKLFLVARDGENTKSNQLDDRLSTGALVEEIELKGDRLNYRLAVGTGPTTGWVFWPGGFGGLTNLFVHSQSFSVMLSEHEQMNRPFGMLEIVST